MHFLEPAISNTTPHDPILLALKVLGILLRSVLDMRFVGVLGGAGSA